MAPMRSIRLVGEQGLKNAAGLFVGESVELLERLFTPRRKPQFCESPVLLRRLPAQQTAALELSQHPAQVCGVDSEIFRDLAGLGRNARRQFVKDTRLGQTVPAVQQSFVERANEPGIHPVEAAKISGFFGEAGRCESARRHGGIVNEYS